jgi:hypothetical protein
MTRRPVGAFAVCVVLAAILTVCVILDSAVVDVAIAPVAAAMLGAEFDRSGEFIGRRIVLLASRVLPQEIRKAHSEEWLDHVRSAGDDGLRPVLTAIDIALRSAPRIALASCARRFYGTFLLVYAVESVCVAQGSISNKVVASSYRRFVETVREAQARPAEATVVRAKVARVVFHVAKTLTVLFSLYALPLQVVLLRRTMVRRGKRTLCQSTLAQSGVVVAILVWGVPVMAGGLGLGLRIGVCQMLVFIVYASVTARVADNFTAVFRRGGALICGRTY